MNPTTPHSAAIAVLFIGTHDLFLESFENLLSIQPDMGMVGTLATVQEALEQVPHLRPDVILIDLPIDENQSLQAVDAIHHCAPETPIIATAGMATTALAERMGQVGVRRTIQRGASAHEIVTAIRELSAGAPQGFGPEDEQLTVTGFMTIEPGTEALVLSMIDELVTRTRAEPGCINYDFYQHNTDKARFVFYENFVNRAAFDAHLAAPHTQAWIDHAQKYGARFDVHFWTMVSVAAG